MLLLLLFALFASGDKIIGGVPTKNETFPFMASLQGFDGKHFCGASLISPTFLLTAWHCVKYLPPKQIRVGSLDNTQGGTLVTKIKKVHYYPIIDVLNYDVALIELVHPLSLTTITLEDGTTSSVTYKGDTLGIGWGSTTEGGGVVRYLLQAPKMPIMDDALCRKYNAANTLTCYCSGSDMLDFCAGDSGSPILSKSPGGMKNLVQVGIVSRGRGCAESPYFGVNVRTSYFYEWIDSVVKLSLQHRPKFDAV